jgi:hypothetical protein
LSRIFCTGLISGTKAPMEPVLMSIFGLVRAHALCPFRTQQSAMGATDAHRSNRQNHATGVRGWRQLEHSPIITAPRKITANLMIPHQSATFIRRKRARRCSIILEHVEPELFGVAVALSVHAHACGQLKANHHYRRRSSQDKKYKDNTPRSNHEKRSMQD